MIAPSYLLTLGEPEILTGFCAFHTFQGFALIVASEGKRPLHAFSCLEARVVIRLTWLNLRVMGDWVHSPPTMTSLKPIVPCS